MGFYILYNLFPSNILLSSFRWQIKLTSFYWFEYLRLIRAFEWKLSLREQHISDNTNAPNITLFIIVIFENFWADIVSTSYESFYIWYLWYRQSKIYDSQFGLIDNYIIQFNISMNNAYFVYSLDSLKKLLYPCLNLIFTFYQIGIRLNNLRKGFMSAVFKN